MEHIYQTYNGASALVVDHDCKRMFITFESGMFAIYDLVTKQIVFEHQGEYRFFMVHLSNKEEFVMVSDYSGFVYFFDLSNYPNDIDII